MARNKTVGPHPTDALRKTFTHLGLSDPAAKALSVLVTASEPLSAPQIAKKAGLARSNTSIGLNRLLDDKLVARTKIAETGGAPRHEYRAYPIAYILPTLIAAHRETVLAPLLDWSTQGAFEDPETGDRLPGHDIAHFWRETAHALAAAWQAPKTRVRPK